MHRAGLHISRPSDILDIALDAAQKLFQSESFEREDDAEDYLRKTGFHSPTEKERRNMLLSLLKEKTGRREELEELIEQVKRGPSSPEEIKEMLSQPKEEGIYESIS
jgi:hypothetical protein